MLSPFRKASLEVAPSSECSSPANSSSGRWPDKFQTAVSPSETEPASSPHIKRARQVAQEGAVTRTPKSLHFLDSSLEEDEQPSSARVYRLDPDEDSSSGGEEAFPLDPSSRGLADAAVHVQTPDSVK